MIEGGWICRACWKSNRPQDDRCYRCKTPRDHQLDVEAGSLKELTEPGYKMRGRVDTRFGVVAALVAWPMWLSGWLAIIFGGLAFVVAILSVIGGNAEGGAVSGIAAAVIVGVGVLFVFISRSVRRNARWAYAIAALGYLLPAIPYLLLGMGDLPAEVTAQLPDWYETVQTVVGLVYLMLGICAVFLLVASFMKPEADQGSPTTEAG